MNIVDHSMAQLLSAEIKDNRSQRLVTLAEEKFAQALASAPNSYTILRSWATLIHGEANRLRQASIKEHDR